MLRIRGRPGTYTVKADGREIPIDAVPVEMDRDIANAYGVSLQTRRQDWVFDVMELRAADGTPQEPAPGDTFTIIENIDAAGQYSVTRVWKVGRPAAELPDFEHYNDARTAWRIHTTLKNET